MSQSVPIIRPAVRHWGRGAIISLVLVAATLGVYAQVLRFDFVMYDDPQFVTHNETVRGGLTAQGLAWAFSANAADYWRPLSLLSHMLDCDISRMVTAAPGSATMKHEPELNPAVHHATSVLFHVANTLLLFGLLHAMTRAVWRSALVAAVFALHPLHVESVAWVTERKDVLSTFFALLSIWAYAAYARRPGLARYLLVAALFALGLMAKPMIVTLPLVLLLLDYWPLERLGSVRAGMRLFAEKLPLLVLSAASGIVTYLVQRDIGAAAGSQIVPIHLRVANALLSYVRYLGKTVWPDDLTVYYPHLILPGAAPWSGTGVALCTALLLIITLSVVVLRRRRYAAVGWLWYLGTLVPMIGLVQAGSQAMADRYTYIPLIGIFIAVVWGVADATERFPRVRAIVSIVAVAVVAGFAFGAWRWQVPTWTNSLTLFENALKIHPGDPRMWTNLGFVHQNNRRYDKAYGHYQEALHADAGFCLAHERWGQGLLEQNKLQEAADRFRHALRLCPNSATSHRELARALGKLNALDEAVEHFEQAIRINPTDADVLAGLAIALRRLGRADEAIERLRRAVDIKPRHAAAHQALAALLFTRGRTDEAIEHFRIALDAQPDHFLARYNLAAVLASKGRHREAVPHYRRALELDPNHAMTARDLGISLMALGRIDEAIDALRRTLELNPDIPEAQLELEKAMQMKNAGGAAS